MMPPGVASPNDHRFFGTPDPFGRRPALSAIGRGRRDWCFDDLRRGLPLISPSLLSARLKSLERVGVVQRTTNGKNVSYHLTESGEVLKPIVMQLGGAPLGAQ